MTEISAKLINETLERIENENNVQILLAVESGSRAWGFPSPDSDWDVRFVYARPMEDHVSLTPIRSVLEYPDAYGVKDLDVVGWDLRKYLNLGLLGNATVLEWLYSPIQYRTKTPFIYDIWGLKLDLEKRNSFVSHYKGLAHSIRAKYLNPKETEVNYKKYIYVIRPILCLLWCKQNHNAFPPQNINRLLQLVHIPDMIRLSIDELLAAKAEMSEIGKGPRMDSLDKFIDLVLTATPTGRDGITPKHLLDRAQNVLLTHSLSASVSLNEKLSAKENIDYQR